MAILANKNGTIISVVPTLKINTWKENCPKGSFFYVKPNEEHRKVFEGTNAVNDALEWIGTPEALALKVNTNEHCN